MDEVKFNKDGLVPVIIQDYKNEKVLMLAWMNKEALELSVKTKMLHYYSRSRQKLWKKGERSGQFQYLKNIMLDCDGDSILCRVEQVGVACHTGRVSCFYRKLMGNGWKIFSKIKIPEDELYKDF